MGSDTLFGSVVLPAVAVAAITTAVAVVLIVRWIARRSCGSARMRDVAARIRRGAWVFLSCEWVVLLPLLLMVGFLLGWGLHPARGICFLVGAVCSALGGGIGMAVATSANVRTAEAAQRGVAEALRVAFAGGVAIGLTIATLGLVGMTMTYALTRDIFAVSCFAMGASLVALLFRVGGGIYTKAADIAADLVGKTELKLDEDDPRNPAVIADNVGDNVGDVAGMGADLFESYVAALGSAMLLGLTRFGMAGVSFPLLLMVAGLAASLLGAGAVAAWTRWRPEADPGRALSLGLWVASLSATAGAIWLARIVFHSWELGLAVAVGSGAGLAIGKITGYFTGGGRVEMIARCSTGGAAPNIISGLGLGLASTFPTALAVALGAAVSFGLAGLYGVALAGVGMLCTLGMTLSVDAYGPIADNAGGIAKMSGLSSDARHATDKLDALGNTTAAIGKGFAIGSAALTALALFALFGDRTGLNGVDIAKPPVYVGALTGAAVAFLFCSITIQAVGGAAHDMIGEIRRQFREVAGLMEGRAEPDSAPCIKIATLSALRSMVWPALIAVLTPFAIYWLLGAEAVGGMILGTAITGLLLAVFMANAGGAWDNAKKLVESGHFGGSGSFAHQATIVGDTVGDPLKDTAGPSLNILIKLMAIVSIVGIPPLMGR